MWIRVIKSWLSILFLIITISTVFLQPSIAWGKEHVGFSVYYVIPTAGPYEIRGVLFKAYLYTNVSVGWGEATLSSIPFYIGGVKVVANYIGEATFYTNDTSIAYCDGCSGRLYKEGNNIWFLPLIAKNGTLLSKTDVPIFKVGEQATVIHRQPAKLFIKWVEKFGNPKVDESLRNAGIVGGALLDLEPMPIADYAVISTVKVGEGVIISENDLVLNGTKSTLYLVTASDITVRGIDRMVEGYRPLYTISLGGVSPLPVDIFVFIIANATYMRAWRLTPLGYISPIEQKTYTYTIKLPTTKPMEAIVISNTTISRIDSSSFPYEIKLDVECEPGYTGYLTLILPKQLNLVVKSAIIDGKTVEIKEVNKNLSTDSIGFSFTYSCIQKPSTITIHLYGEETTTTTTTTVTETTTKQTTTTLTTTQTAQPLSTLILVILVPITIIVIATIAIRRYLIKKMP